MKNIAPEHAQLHQNFVQYGTNAKEWMRKCVLLLPEIAQHRIWQQKGFGSLYEYAAKLAGMSRNTVDDALRILHKIEDKPALRRVVEEKGIHAVRPVAAIATPETESFWAEKASVMSKHTLEVYVQEYVRAETDFRPGTGNTSENPQQQAIENIPVEVFVPPKTTVVMQLDPDISAKLQKLKGAGDWNTLMKEFLQIREAQLEEQKPQPVTTDSRHIPNAIQRHVRHKTNDTCSFPRCAKPSKILHHTQRFALEKIHDPDRLEPLCTEHERIAHLGLIEHEEFPAKYWQIRMQSDTAHAKYHVDQMVARHRT
ncbi:MAG: hypothetical protein AAB551_03050 [Patescibacteria group bacterium]